MTEDERYAYENELLKLLSVSFELNSYELPQKYILSNLTSFSSKGMTINLNFSDPILIS